EEAEVVAFERGQTRAAQAFVRRVPGGHAAQAQAAVTGDIRGLRCHHCHDAADRVTAVQRGRGPVQHLDALDESGVDEVAGRITEAADRELPPQRHSVYQQHHPVAADPAYVEALCAEANACGFVVYAGFVAKRIGETR